MTVRLMTARPIDLGSLRKILVIKLRYIGDVLITTPFIRALKENLPQASLTALVSAGTDAVLADNPCLDRVIAYDKNKGFAADLDLIKLLRSERFDACFDLTDADRSAWLGFLSGSRYRVGFEGGGWLRKNLLYTHALPPPPLRTHQIDRNLALAEWLGFNIRDRALTLFLTPHEAEQGQKILRDAGADPSLPYAVLHTAARTLYKSWPAERFAAIADRLNDQGVQVLLTGAKGDSAMVKPVMEYMNSRAIDLTGKTDLRTLAVVIKGAAVFVGNDSGPMHIASAVGTPVVALFGPTDWESWYPRGMNDTFFSKEIDCRPCGHAVECNLGEQSCMGLISLEEVWDAVKQRLGTVKK